MDSNKPTKDTVGCDPLILEMQNRLKENNLLKSQCSDLERRNKLQLKELQEKEAQVLELERQFKFEKNKTKELMKLIGKLSVSADKLVNGKVTTKLSPTGLRKQEQKQTPSTNPIGTVHIKQELQELSRASTPPIASMETFNASFNKDLLDPNIDHMAPSSVNSKSQQNHSIRTTGNKIFFQCEFKLFL